MPFMINITTDVKVKKISKLQTSKELEDDHDSHDCPHGILADLVVEGIEEIEERNKNQGNPNLNTVNHLPLIMHASPISNEADNRIKT